MKYFYKNADWKKLLLKTTTYMSVIKSDIINNKIETLIF